MGLKNFDAKQFLLEKGERVGLGIALFLMVVLIVLNLFVPPNGFFSGRPQTKVAEIQKLITDTQNALRNNVPQPGDTPGDAQQNQFSFEFDPLNAQSYEIKQWLTPRRMDDPRRRMPEVLAANQAHAEVVLMRLQSFLMDDLESKDPQIYILKDAPDKPQMSKRKVAMLKKMLKKRGIDPSTVGLGSASPASRTGMPPGTTPGQMPNQYLSGMMRGGNQRNFRMGDSGPAKEHVLEPIRLSQLEENPNLVTAQQGLPVRMAIIAASFPFRAQLEEFRDKLHLQSLLDVLQDESQERRDNMPLPAFRFLRVNVERRTLDAGGQPTSKWEPLDLNSMYKPFMILTGQEREPENPQYKAIEPDGLVMPRLKQFNPSEREAKNTGGAMPMGGPRGFPGMPGGGRMPPGTMPPGTMPPGTMPPGTMPPRGGLGAPGMPGMPGGMSPFGRQQPQRNQVVYENQYPDEVKKLPNLVKTLEDLKDKAPAEVTPPSKFRVSNVNVFSGAADAEENTNNAQNTITTPGAKAESNYEPPEYCLIRVIDPSVQPGEIYQYRLQVVMANPNYKRTKDVASPAYGNEKELVSDHWFEVPQSVVVPQELQYYVVDQEAVDKQNGQRYKGPYARINFHEWQLPMQAQRWLIQLPGHKSLFVGDWVVAERFPVNRGEYIGRTELIEVPYWSPTNDSEAVATERKGRNPNAGIPVNFGYERNDGAEAILVDFAGGRQTYTRTLGKAEDDTQSQKQEIQDMTGYEALILTPDGKLLARNSVFDANDAARKKRLKDYLDSLKAAYEASKPGGASSPAGGGNGLFNR